MFWNVTLCITQEQMLFFLLPIQKFVIEKGKYYFFSLMLGLNLNMVYFTIPFFPSLCADLSYSMG